MLNKLAVNCARSFPDGYMSWGARTLDGADHLGSEWKYIPIRRLALFIEESLYRGTKWVVFEPNDEPLWAKIRLNVGVFMNGLFRQGAFQGSTPQEAYFVKCDKETTTQADRNLGIVNIEVGFAPLKPAEFVVITIQQIAGDLTDLESGRNAHGQGIRRQRHTVSTRTRISSSADVGRPHRRSGSARSARSSGPPRSSSTAKAGTTARDRKSPGRTSYEAITLERGVTHDAEFEAWANLVHTVDDDPAHGFEELPQGPGAAVLQRGGPREELLAVPLLGQRVPGAPRSGRQRQRDRDRVMKLELEGWERDVDTKEPDEASPVPASA